VTGSWPTVSSGAVAGVPGETWRRVAVALREGGRGLPGGDTLARLLARRRGARTVWTAPPLTVPQVLAWADEHRRRTGRWPTKESGPVEGVAGETWSAVATALRKGGRGLPGGDTSGRLLARHAQADTPAGG
jgi:hypothetical protein